MRIVVYLPLALSVLLALPGVSTALCRTSDRIDPRIVLRLLAAAIGVVATASTLALGLLAAGGVARLVVGTDVLVGRHAVPGGYPVGVVAALVLVVVAVRAGRGLVLGGRRRRRARALVPVDERAEVTFVDDDAVYAVAAPGHRRRPGRVIASRGLWAALEPAERAVVLAHERAHLDGHHHRHLALAHLATGLNPLLRGVRDAIAYTLERCADEAAVRQVGDRSVAARAVGRAALAVRRHPPAAGVLDGPGGVDPGLALGVATGPVPRRVAALLTPDETCAAAWTTRLRRPGTALRSGDLWAALVTVTVVALGVALVVAAMLHAVRDLGDVHGVRDLLELLR